MSVHQLRITLEDIDPPVWRRLHVPSSVILAQLHQAIQVVMVSWEGYHLHSFTAGWDEYGNGGGGEDEHAVTLAGVLPNPGGVMLYLYDFGDEWRHLVEVEKVHRPAPHLTYPRCSAGRRACLVSSMTSGFWLIFRLRREALLIRVEVRDPHRLPVAADRRS